MALLLTLLALAFLITGAVASPLDLPLSRGGTKQGPLLLIDDLLAAGQAFLDAGPSPASPSDHSALAAELAALKAPGEAEWQLPPPPELSEGTFVFLPPFASGCCTTQGGSGGARVDSEDDRGVFEMNLLASSGQQAYAVASPCLDFRSPVDGVARCTMALVVNGVAAAGPADAGEARVAFGPWIAHCHPKDQGRYSQHVAQLAQGLAGRVTWQGAVVRQRAEFPVRAGVDYKFGTGLWAATVASGDAGVALRLWGRLAYLTVQCVAKP
jgi:hypothetical protein